MEGEFVRGSGTSRLQRYGAGSRWRYEGIGWPRSCAQIRLWIPGTVVVVALTIWGYVSIGPGGRLEHGRIDQHKTDFTVFTEAGAAFFDGRDPYRVANPRGWHYLYPPLFALLVSPLSIFDTESQVVIWYVVNAAFAFGCLANTRRLWQLVSGGKTHCPLWVAGLAGLAVFLPFLDCMQAGQLGIAILFLLILGFRQVLQGQSRLSWFLGGVILALPAVIKLVPSLPVVFLLFQRWSAVVKRGSTPRSWTQAGILTAGVLAGVFLFLVAIPASLIGWRANLNYLNAWGARVVTNERVGHDSNFNIHSYRNQSLANAVYLWDKATAAADVHAKPLHDRPERVVHPAIRVVVGVILAALLMVSCSLGPNNDCLDQAVAYGLACCAMLLISPLTWGHYYMAEAPAVLLVPIWLLRRGRSTQAKVVALIPPVLSWSHYLAMPYTGEFGVLGLGTTAWFLGVCGLILGCEVAVALTAIRPQFQGQRQRLSARPYWR
jgi:hypothetical protein